jgi:hypothetical protein
MKENKAVHVMTAPNPGIRLYIGLGIFILSFFMLPLGLFLQHYVTVHYMKHIVIGIFWLIAPTMKIGSVAILGKPSYLYIKSKFQLHLFKVIKPYHESRLRYNIGLFLFCLPLVPTYIMAYAPMFFSSIFSVRLILNISFDVIFIISLFVLGGDFWDKLKALFIFSAKAKFEEK